MLKNTILVTLFLILSSIFGFFAQIVFFRSFGASVEMDVYFTLLALPTIITGMASTVFVSVLVPYFAMIKIKVTDIGKLIYTLWLYVAIFVLIFTLIGYFLTVKNLDFLVQNLPIKLKNKAIQLSLMIWVASGLSFSSSYLSSILNYNQQFIKVAWTSILPSTLMILSVTLLHDYIGVRSIALGFLIAYFIQFIVFYSATRKNFVTIPLKIKQIYGLRVILKNIFYVALSLLPFTLFGTIGYYWVSSLHAGSVSYLGYSQSFAGFLSIAASMGISIVAFPSLADSHANGRGNAALHKFEITLRYILLISTFMAGSFIALNVPVLRLFYQQRLSDQSLVYNLAEVVPWYLCSAIFVSGINYFRTLIYSSGHYKRFAIIGVIISLMFIFVAKFFVEKFSTVGVGMANTLVFAILFFLLAVLYKSLKESFLTWKFYFFIINLIIVTALACIITSMSFVIIANHISEIIAIGVCLLIFSIVFYFLARFIFIIREIYDMEMIFLPKMKMMLKINNSQFEKLFFIFYLIIEMRISMNKRN